MRNEDRKKDKRLYVSKIDIKNDTFSTILGLV
jgi:hypothetical protein